MDKKTERQTHGLAYVYTEKNTINFCYFMKYMPVYFMIVEIF